MLERLKNLNMDRMDIDDAVALLAYAKTVLAEYDHVGLESPLWLDSSIKELKREIRDRSQDSIQKRLRDVRARLENLKTPEEKRAQLEKEAADLEAKIA